MGEANDEPQEEKKPQSGARRFFGAFRTKLWAGIIAVLVGATIAYGQSFVSWIGKNTEAELRTFIEGIVQDTIASDLAASGEDATLRAAMDEQIETALGTGGAISVAFGEKSDRAIQQRIDEALLPDGIITTAVSNHIDTAMDGRVGSVIGGSLELNPRTREQTLFFYLPGNHQVVINADVRGLAEGEIITLVSEGFVNQATHREISRNGPTKFVFVGQNHSARGMAGTEARVLVERDDRRFTDDLIPVGFRLAHRQQDIAAALSQGRRTPPLSSNASVTFVALMTPPLRHSAQ